MFAADVDGDGDMDVLSASGGDAKIAWYENDGDGNFTEHIISMSLRGGNSVFAADVDGDEDMDVLGASWARDKIVWYENLSPPPLPADLTGDGLVDFGDLTLLLSNWNREVSAAEGNLVDAAGSAVDFRDLTALLGAWTGSWAAGAAQAAVVGGDSVGDFVGVGSSVAVGDASYRRHDESPRRARTDGSGEVVMLKHNLRGARRLALRSDLAGGSYGRLQAAAVDAVLAEEGSPRRERIVARRGGRGRR